jgi:phenylalanyl-tRNA synthetase beta chain
MTTLERLGNDVEGYSVVSRYKCAACGHVTEALEHEDFNNRCEECGADGLTVAGWSEVVRINLLPVRPDMFDEAGLARALRGYLGIESGLPRYTARDSGLRILVTPGLESIRPFIVASVMRGLALDDETVKMLMKMQENLHWALGRDRRRASIGMYDLDTLKPDLEYRPVEPAGVRFTPLLGMPGDRTAKTTPGEILAGHPKGVAYRHLLQPFSRYPLLCDSAGTVLSMPPIINSEETRVTERTTNLLVDVTGPDRSVIAVTLCVIAAALADLGAKLETVAVVYPDGSVEKAPDMTPRERTLDPTEAARVLGIDISAAEVAGLLTRMRYDARPSPTGVTVLAPAYRSDIMHDYDLIEDVAISYGYHRITPRLVPSLTIGTAQPVEERSQVCRRALTGLGFMETMTLVLTSRDAHIVKMRVPDDGSYAQLDNPASVEQTITRRDLRSGILETFRVNSAAELPQHIFEVGDVFEPDESAETGVRMTRCCGIGMAGPKAGFADMKAVVEAVCRELAIGFTVEPLDHPTFIPGRCARLRDEQSRDVGVVGEVHPEVLEALGLGHPVALAELALSGRSG